MNEELKVIISATVKPLEKSIQDVNKKLGTLDKTTQQTTKSMSKSFDKSIASINKVGVALAAAAAAAVVSLGKIMKSSMDSANDLFTLSSQTGLTTDRLQELQYAAEMTGASADKLQRGVLSVSRAVEAGNPALAAMGINTTDSAEAFEQALIGLSQMEEGTAKQTLGNELLGRSYADLKPLIDQGADGIRQLTQAAHANGAVMSGELLQSLETLRTSLFNMRQAFKAAFYPILEIVIPVLQKMVGWLQVAALWTRAFFGLFSKASKDSTTASKKLENSMNKVSSSIGDAGAGTSSIGSGLKNANKEAKKLQRTLFGFDVIHNIDEPQDSDSSVGGVGGIGDIGKITVDPIDFGDVGAGIEVFEEVQKQIEEIQRKMKEAWDSWGKYALAAAAVVAGVMSVPALVGGLSALAGWIAGLATSGGLLETVFLHVWIALEKLGEGIITKLGLKMAVDGLGSVMLALGAVIAVIAAVVGALVQLWNTNEDFRNKMIEAWEAIKGSIMVAWNDFIKPVFSAIVDVVMMIIDRAIMPLWNSWVKLVEYISMAMADLIIAIQPAYQMIVKWLGKILPPIIRTLGDIFSTVMAAISGVVGVAFEIIGAVIAYGIELFAGIIKFLTAVFTGDWEGAWDAVLGIMDSFKKMVERIWDAIKDFLVRILGNIKDTVVHVWDNIGAYLGLAMEFIKTLIGLAWEAIKFLIGKALEAIKFVITNIWDWIKAYIKLVMDGITTVIKVIWDGIKAYFTAVMEFIKLVFSTAWDIIELVVSTVMDVIWKNISTVWGTIKGVFNGVIDFVKNVFTGNWRGAWDNVIQIFRNLFGFIPKIFKTAWDGVMKLFSGGGKIFKGFAESVADIFKKLVNSLIRGINTVIGAPFKALNRSFDKFRGISILGAKPFGFLPNIGIPAIPQFAQGGFPEDGLFHANSRELVGKFSNGKTAVANNDQIISGVSTGVANAVRSVLGDGAKSDQPINLTVQIGSNTIAKEVINAVDDYTMKTGMTFKTV